MRIAPRGRSVFVSVVALLVVGVTYWRLYYGIDLTDESFYVAVPYRLALGARPFVDETAVAQQLAGVLLYPFVLGWHAVAGTTGIVLFMRHLQFAFSLAVFAAVLLALRPVLGSQRATLVALVTVAFVPFDIHSLSYNTLGGGFFTAGCFLGFQSLRQPDRKSLRILAGLSHGLAVFVYPLLIGAVVLCLLLRVALTRGRARRDTFAFDLPALCLPLAGLAALVAAAGLEHLRADYRLSRTSAVKHADLHKLALIAAHEWHTLGLGVLVVPALAVVALTWTRCRPAARAALLVLPVLALPAQPRTYTASIEYVAHYGWLALPLLLAVRRREPALQLFCACWIPAAIGGATTAYTSSNGGVNAGIGFFPAAIVTTVFLVWALEESGAGRAAAAPALAVIALMLFFAIPVYRDGALTGLTSRLGEGAYAGLATTPAKRAFLTQLRGDLGGIRGPCTIVFFDDFPAGYLLTSARPDTNGVWLARGARRERALLAYYGARGFPNVAVVLDEIPYGPGGARREHYRAGDPLIAALHAHAYRLTLSRASYRVYRRPSSRCR